MKLLVTGAAGFIGLHTARLLLERGDEVVGLDNLNAYYDPGLKAARLQILQRYPNFRFEHIELADRVAMLALFDRERFRRVVHLAAQAGVRHSTENPFIYVDSNVTGFLHVLEGCRRNAVEHLVYASTSSVYGANTRMPFAETQNVDHPLSLYAATKKANELMAHAYSHLYRIPATGLRFFTVYGPWGRPDMAMFIFAKAIIEGAPIKLFNHGNMRRDFTFVEDVSEAILRLMERPPQGNPGWSGDRPDPSTSAAPWKIYNIGNNNPEELRHVVSLLEKEFGRVAIKEMLPMQPGDVPATYADVEDLARDIGFRPSTTIEEGVARFVKWYRNYHNL